MRLHMLWIIILTGFVTLALPPCTSLAQSAKQISIDNAIKRGDDSQLIEGLRQRRLFDLAELYCKQQLANSKLDPTSQSLITVELIKSQTAKAVLAPAGERTIAWDLIKDTAVSFPKNYPDHPRKILVKVQLALSHITHGKLILQEIAAEMAEKTASSEALAELRVARGLLSDLERDIAKAIPELRGRSVTEHDLTVEQLLTLKNNLRYQSAVCNLNQSQLFAKDDRLNRNAALNSVKESLAEVAKSTSEGEPLWWTTKLGQIECFRLMGDTGAAKQLVDSLPTKDIPRSTKPLLVEGKIRLAIEMGNEPFSQQVIKEFDDLAATNAQLDLAMIELAISQSLRAPTDEHKKQWLDFASQSAKAIELKRGAYWGRRADLVLINAAGSSGKTNPLNPLTKTNDPPKTGTNSMANTELDQLIRIGEDAVRKSNLGDAIKAYSTASAKARELGDSNQALRLDMLVGQIFEKQSQTASAAERFIQAALNDPKADFASSSHLRGCWNLANTIKAKPDNARAFETQLLRHLELWPEEASANQARMYLASQYQSTGQSLLALENYLKVRNDSGQFPGAIDRAAGIATSILEGLRKQKKSTTEESEKIVKALQSKRLTLKPSAPSGYRLDLISAELDVIYGGQIINPIWNSELAAIESSTDVSLANSARAIRAAINGPTDPKLAKTLITKIGSDIGSLSRCERCFAGGDSKIGNTGYRKIRLELIENLLNRSPTTSLLIRKSQVLSQLGRHGDSVEVLMKLEKQFPKNAAIQLQLARALTQKTRGGDTTEALVKWRRLQGQLKSYTPNWFEAKLNVAKLLALSGKKAEALKLLKLLKEVGPGWDKSELKSELEAMLQSLE